MPAIPVPVLVGDSVEASLYTVEEGVVLVLGTPPALPSEALLRAKSALTIRCAIAYLQRNDVLVPGLFASEYGAMLVGREAWDYAMKHHVLHPRADLVGLRSDGQQDQVMLRELDFGRDIAVLAYEHPDASIALTPLDAYWANSDAPELPDLLTEYLPRLQTLSAPES
jgi:hypothetical protein